MDDASLVMGDGLDDNDKEPKKKVKSSRNVSEKKRRDKLNIYISELASMVPSCVSSQRKLDKTTVLKMTVSYMKIHNDLTLSFLGNETGLISSFLSSEELGELLDKALNGFLLVLSPNGEFVFISNSIEDLLGLKKEELIGKNLSDVVHPEDRDRIMQEVLLQGRNQIPELHTELGNGTTSTFAIRMSDMSHSSSHNPSRISLDFRMLVRGQDGEPVGEEDIHCVGFFDHWMKKSSENKRKGTQDSKDNAIAPFSTFGNTANPLFLVGVGIVARPSFSRAVECECNENQFTSRHSLDGKFLFIDPKSISITGYLPFEVLGTSVYDYIHHEDLMVYSKSHESLMEYGEGKTECYRLRIKSGQWTWAKTRSYIAFNHWNSKPEIYYSTTKMISAADGANSLKERGTAEIENGDQEKRHSRFSFLRQSSIKFNSSQEANAMVLAKWAEDESTIVTTLEESNVKVMPGEEQSATPSNKPGESGPLAPAERIVTIEMQGNPGSENELKETDQEEPFELPATVEELENFRQAQRMLQDQLLEKHSILMKAITKQKAQLQEIQRQMILNLQSQMYVDPIKLQDTCSGYIERNKDLSERRQEQEQTLESIARTLEEQMKNADRRYQLHYNKLLDKRGSEVKTVGSIGDTCSQQGTEDYTAEPPVGSATFNVFAGSDGHRQQQQQQDSRAVLSPLQLVSVDSSVNLQQHAHIEEVQGNITGLKRSGTMDTNPRSQKAMRVSVSSRPPMWQEGVSTGARAGQQQRQQQSTVAAALPRSWESYITSQAVSSQGFGQTLPGSNQSAGTVTETTNALSTPLPASRDMSRDAACRLNVQTNQSMQRQETIQSQFSLGAMDSPQTFQQGYHSPQLNMDIVSRGASTSQSPTGQTGLGQTPSGPSAVGFGIQQLAAISPNFASQPQQQIQQQQLNHQQQQQQQPQNSQISASIAQTVTQLLSDSSQNQQLMQVVLSVLSALQSQPQVATTLASLLKQVQGNQQEETVQQMAPVASPQPPIQPSAAQFLLASCSQAQLQNSRQPPAYSANPETVYQQQQQQQIAMFQNQQRGPLQQQNPPPPPPPRPQQQQQQQQQHQQRAGLAQHSRRDTSCLGMPRVTSTSTSYSVALHHQQQRLQQQQQQQQQQQIEQRQLQQQLARNVSMSTLTGSPIPSSSAAAMNYMPYGSIPSTSTGSPADSALENSSSSGKRKSSNSKTDYFSNFSPEELSSMMLDAPPRNVAMSNNEGASTSSSNQQEKKLEGEELLYNPLLTQQQQLLQLHQEQRRQLLVQQQEQRLQMFEAQRRREAVVTGQQQQAGSSHRSPSYSTGGGLHAMLSETGQEGTSRQTGDQNIQDTGPSFSGWSESNNPLGDAEEQVLSLLLAESASYDPFLDNIDWADDTYGGQINLNPD
ncbi:neuronal PAS domain-containing protein 2-like isoform X2 [Montipora foliosa]|uniref:neuronal PAS domain-containing protein 2-like isoform X2 n=1 Tax=Montipora foliosa TaxID=591990 RepID=UPI0035F1C837